MATMDKKTAIVTVTTPCTCGAERWFSCRCAEVVAEYLCDALDDVEGRPDPDQVAWIERAHPGMNLIYIG